ncbi:MAG: DUF4231 domain-containing protein [Methanothrix sp.]|jgi:uncharacterized membrane protein YuzA (DUF378 family)|nr:DUF4231 domain-containing protein [Methanothrix sp.]
MVGDQTPSFPSFPPLTGDNDSEALRTYLKAVYDFSVYSTQENINWYSAKAVPYSKNAQTTRFGAILFVALAGITPLFVGTGLLPTTSTQILTQITYIFIGIAALLVGMDKFFGYSSSWMRYITTKLALETLLAKFRFDWAVASVGAVNNLDASACKPLLELAQKFAVDVQSKIENETAEWATELRNNLSEIDKTTSEKWEAARQVNKPPVIESLEPGKSSPQSAGTAITWTAKASDFENDPISYRFFLNDKPVTDWQSENKWIWETTAANVGKNTIEVRIIDGKHAGSDGYDARKSADFEISAIK